MLGDCLCDVLCMIASMGISFLSLLNKPQMPPRRANPNPNNNNNITLEMKQMMTAQTQLMQMMTTFIQNRRQEVWGCEAYVKKLMPDKLEPKAEKCVFIGYPKETIGYTFYHRTEGKVFVAKNGSFLEKEFLLKEVSGRKVELDEVVEPSLELESSAAPEIVPVPPAPTIEEANDKDHEASDDATTERCRSTRSRAPPEWYGNPVLTSC